MIDLKQDGTILKRQLKPIKLIGRTRAYAKTRVQDSPNVVITQPLSVQTRIQDPLNVVVTQPLSVQTRVQDSPNVVITQPLSVQTRVQDPPNTPTPQPLSVKRLALQEFSKSLYTTEPLPGLHKHWMSVRQQRIFISLIFLAVGFCAITALAIAIVGWLPLDIAAYIFVWPSLIIWLVLGTLYPDYGKLALKGFVIGVLACFFYDCMRFVTIGLGLWGDFIPSIGMWLLHTNKPDWVVGYIWRYVGDGGFMSVAFVMGYRLLRPRLDVRIAALIFGIAIWLCLVGTILLAPHGSEMLFSLTPLTLSLSLLGHIIYGLSIGFLYPVFISKNAPAWQAPGNSSDLLSIPNLPQTWSPGDRVTAERCGCTQNLYIQSTSPESPESRLY